MPAILRNMLSAQLYSLARGSSYYKHHRSQPPTDPLQVLAWVDGIERVVTVSRKDLFGRIMGPEDGDTIDAWYNNRWQRVILITNYSRVHFWFEPECLRNS